MSIGPKSAKGKFDHVGLASQDSLLTKQRCYDGSLVRPFFRQGLGRAGERVQVRNAEKVFGGYRNAVQGTFVDPFCQRLICLMGF